MHKLAAISFAFLGACATTSFPMNGDVTPSAHPQLAFALAGPVVIAAAGFPEITNPRLPDANRMQRQIRDQLGDRAVATVALCVVPSGKVASVELLQSSTMPAFDAAVLRDAARWETAATPGPDTVQMCQHVTIDYRLHQ
jgi:TonB family protein